MKQRGRLKRKIKERSGQAVIEYVLLLSIVLGIVLYFLQNLSSATDKMTARYGGSVEKQLRTGSVPAALWNK